MVKTTEQYRKAMHRPDRMQGSARVEFDVIDPGAAADITARQDNGHVFYSKLEGLEYDNVPDATPVSFEPGRWRCDGSQTIPSTTNTAFYGFTSSILSNSAGIYTVQPLVRFDFGQLRTFRALTLTFDPSGDDYPAKVKAIGYRAGAATVTVEGEPDGPVYELIPKERTGFRNVDRVDILFVAARFPYRRARLQHVLFGYTIAIDTQRGGERGYITGIECSAESDPLNREIAYQDATISIEDPERLYAFDNPQGIWEDMEERIPVRIYFGAQIADGITWGEVFENYTWGDVSRRTWGNLYEGGYYEAFLYGSYWLDSQPTSMGTAATFTAVSLIDLLDFEFKRWPTAGGNLYDLATAVLESVELPRQTDGGALWHLWDGLKDIHTTAPMGIKTCREVLQDIAIAGCCTMFFDRLGALHIEPLPTEEFDFWLDFNSRQIEQPDGEKIPALGGVSTSVYRYTPGETKELHNETYTVAAGETVEITLGSPASGLKVATSGTVEIFSSAVFVTFQTAGTYSIVVTGNVLEESASVISNPVEDARPAAAWAVLENRLLTDKTQAAHCGQWFKEYLQKRITYTLESQGYPEIDVYDKIQMQSWFNEQLPVYVLSHNLSFDGAFWSNLIVKVDTKE